MLCNRCSDVCSEVPNFNLNLVMLCNRCSDACSEVPKDAGYSRFFKYPNIIRFFKYSNIIHPDMLFSCLV